LSQQRTLIRGGEIRLVQVMRVPMALHASFNDVALLPDTQVIAPSA